MNKKVSKYTAIIALIFILFLTTDTIYTFYQNYNLPLDGDMTPIIAPNEHYSQVLKDPFGISVIKEGNQYAATNRFFSHISMVGYYKNFYSFISPLFKNKINCIYFVTALFNTLVQLLLIFLFTVYIRGKVKFWSYSFLLTAVIVTPFFQMDGYYDCIGIVDRSVTYTFFYGLPFGILLLYLLPFYLSFYNGKAVNDYLKLWMYPIWLALSVYLSFSSPLIPPVLFVACPSFFLFTFYTAHKKNINQVSFFNQIITFTKKYKGSIFLWVFFMIVCMYSFYIGKFNIESAESIPLTSRYIKLAKGIPLFLTYKIVFFLIALLLGVNAWLIKIYAPQLIRKNQQFLFLVLILCSIYVLLLPFGGYRPYRPNIVRYDTFLPVTLVLVILIGMTTYSLLSKNILPKKHKSYYIAFIIGLIGIVEFADFQKIIPNANACQKEALYTIQNSDDAVVQLNQDCTVLSWTIMPNPDYTGHIGEMLYYWGISEQPVKFYQVQE